MCTSTDGSPRPLLPTTDPTTAMAWTGPQTAAVAVADGSEAT
ncbi:hypothetical protein [Natrinema salaciae]|nr:hypothetical protein [Natrinema salaciae]